MTCIYLLKNCTWHYNLRREQSSFVLYYRQERQRRHITTRAPQWWSRIVQRGTYGPYATAGSASASDSRRIRSCPSVWPYLAPVKFMMISQTVEELSRRQTNKHINPQTGVRPRPTKTIPPSLYAITVRVVTVNIVIFRWVSLDDPMNGALPVVSTEALPILSLLSFVLPCRPPADWTGDEIETYRSRCLLGVWMTTHNIKGFKTPQKGAYG